jgi:uncharacterized membrane protein YeaQ/YmgE (transglycosylase-associated protein family)
MSDEPKKPAHKVLWLVLAIFVGAFVGFWTAFALFFTYPEPLGLWAHPFVWAAGGAVIGVVIVLWRHRR